MDQWLGLKQAGPLYPPHRLSTRAFWNGWMAPSGETPDIAATLRRHDGVGIEALDTVSCIRRCQHTRDILAWRICDFCSGVPDRWRRKLITASPGGGWGLDELIEIYRS